MVLGKRLMALGLAATGLLWVVGCGDSGVLNVSYDPTRELYKEYNEAFAGHWKETARQTVKFKQSHGGSGKQALAVTQGLQASVVTLALAFDIDLIQKQGLIAEGWQDRLPNHSCPYTSTIVFLVRKGNPQKIRDWDDLVRADVSVITPHPKTSGGARWNYLAAWGYVLKRELGDLRKLGDSSEADAVAKAEAKAREFVTAMYRRVPVLDSGARGSTITFVQNGQGDVLLAWENEAHLALKEAKSGEFQIVTPSVSILAEPPVAVVDKVVDKLGTRKVAEEYLQYLYSLEGQTIAAKHFYRPFHAKDVPAEHLKPFQKIDLFTITEVAGGWDKAHEVHFRDGGLFDQIYQPGK
jgi:sulfate transport system substrate-binding protein